MNGNLRTLMGGGFSAGQASAVNGFSTLAATATGSTQGTAYVLTTELTEFTTVAASTGAILPGTTSPIAPSTGDAFVIVNNGANSLSVYPPTGGQIGTAAANTALALAANKTGIYIAEGNGNFYAIVSA